MRQYERWLDFDDEQIDRSVTVVQAVDRINRLLRSSTRGRFVLSSNEAKSNVDDGHGVKSWELVGSMKASWPELVGMAATQIMHDRPDFAVEVIPPGSKVHRPDPQDNPKRVLVLINVPYVG